MLPPLIVLRTMLLLLLGLLLPTAPADAGYAWGLRGTNDIVQRTERDLTQSGDPIAKQRWYVTDLDSSVVATVSQTGMIIERVSYSPFGEVRHHPLGDLNGDGAVNNADQQILFGNWGNPGIGDLNQDGVVNNADLNILFAQWTNPAHPAGTLSTDGNTIGFTAHIYDVESGLLLARFRVYDAALGRWLSPDPAGFVDGMNLYLYVRGNPLLWWDPYGLWSFRELLRDASFFAQGLAMVGRDAVRDRVTAICEDPGAALWARTPMGQGEAMGEYVLALIEQAKQITEFESELGVAPDTPYHFSMNLLAVFTGMNKIAQGSVGFDRSTGEAITDGLERAGMVSTGIGEGLSIAAGGGAVAGQVGRAVVGGVSVTQHSSILWKTKIHGRAQRTGTPGHQFRTYREAIAEAKNPNVVAVHLDHGYNRSLGLGPTTISPNRRPDVLSIYNDRTVKRIEVQSRSDSPAILRSRNSALDQQLIDQGFTPTPPLVVRPH